MNRFENDEKEHYEAICDLQHSYLLHYGKPDTPELELEAKRLADIEFTMMLFMKQYSCYGHKYHFYDMQWIIKTFNSALPQLNFSEADIRWAVEQNENHSKLFQKDFDNYGVTVTKYKFEPNHFLVPQKKAKPAG